MASVKIRGKGFQQLSGTSLGIYVIIQHVDNQQIKYELAEL